MGLVVVPHGKAIAVRSVKNLERPHKVLVYKIAMKAGAAQLKTLKAPFDCQLSTIVTSITTT